MRISDGQEASDASDPEDASSDGRAPNLRILAAFSVFATIALFVYLMVIAESILLPLVIAVFIVIVLDALASRICDMRIFGRHPPEWLGMTLSIIIMLGAVVWLAEIIRANIAAVRAAAPTYQENIRALADKALSLAGAEQLPSLQDLANQLDFSVILSSVFSALTNVTGNIFTILFYIVFILLEQATFRAKIDAMFRKRDDARRVRETITRISGDIQRYAGLKTAVSLLTGMMSYAVMSLVGVDFAGFWAILIFVLNFIPYVGSLVGVVFPALLTLIQFDSVTPFIITTVTLAGIQTLVGNVIEPRLMGRSLNLSPLVILMSLAIFGSIWGIVGMVLSIPFMVMAMIICGQFEITRPMAVLLSATGRVDGPPDEDQPEGDESEGNQSGDGSDGTDDEKQGSRESA